MAHTQIDQCRQQRRAQHGNGPDDGGVMFPSGVEVTTDPADPADHAAMDAIAMAKRFQLFTQQGQKDREEVHGRR